MALSLSEIDGFVYMAKLNCQTQLAELLDAGWEIHKMPCTCGGTWAWLRPKETGAKEMFGCVCHNTVLAINTLA